MNIPWIIIIAVSVGLIVTVVVMTAASFWRRRDPLPPDMLDGEPAREDAAAAEYLGTFRDGFGVRVSAQGFLDGGPGRLYLSEGGVNFLVQGSLQPIYLPFVRVRRARITELPKARPFSGRRGLCVDWELDDKTLSSVFVAEIDLAPILEGIDSATQSGRDHS